MDLFMLPFEFAEFWNTHFGSYVASVVTLSWTLALIFWPWKARKRKQEAISLWDHSAPILAYIISIFFWVLPCFLAVHASMLHHH